MYGIMRDKNKVESKVESNNRETKYETGDETGDFLMDAPTELKFKEPPLPLARISTPATPTPATPTQGKKTSTGVPENAKFQAAQLIDCARFFGCLQTEEWIKPRATKVIFDDATKVIFDDRPNINNYPLAALNDRYDLDDNRITYYHRGDVQQFLDLFLNIKLEVDSNINLLCPHTSPEIWYTFREQNLQTNDRHVVILLNKLKVVIHRILARRVTTLPGLFEKYEQNISNGSATLLLIIISSFHLPTNSLIKAATFLPQFFSKYTVLSNDSIIRTLLSLCNIEYNQDAIGNPTLQMLETYRKNLYAFESTSSISPTTLTPEILRGIQSYAEWVLYYELYYKLNEVTDITKKTKKHSSKARKGSSQGSSKRSQRMTRMTPSKTRMTPSKTLMIL